MGVLRVERGEEGEGEREMAEKVKEKNVAIVQRKVDMRVERTGAAKRPPEAQGEPARGARRVRGYAKKAQEEEMVQLKGNMQSERDVAWHAKKAYEEEVGQLKEERDEAGVDKEEVKERVEKKEEARKELALKVERKEAGTEAAHLEAAERVLETRLESQNEGDCGAEEGDEGEGGTRWGC